MFSRADAVAPAHLALGVLHTQSQATLDLFFPDPGNFEILCRALGGTSRGAPVIPEEIGYQIASHEALDGATRLAAHAPAGPDTHPIHILLGILRPWSVVRGSAASPDQAALDLAATGLGESRLRALLPIFISGHLRQEAP